MSARALRALLLGALLAGGCRCQEEVFPFRPLPARLADAGPRDAGPDSAGGDDAGPDPAEEADAGCALPPAAEAERVLTGLASPRRVAVDGADVYVVEAGPSLMRAEGQVRHLSRATGAARVLATGFRAPEALAVTADALFVLDADGLWRVDRAQGGARKGLPVDLGIPNNATAGGTDVLLADGTLVVATARSRLYRVQPDGGDLRVLYAGDAGAQVRGLVREGDALLFTVSGDTAAGLYRVGLDGGVAERVDDGVTAGRGLAAGSLGLAVAEGGGRVRLLPSDGGAPLTLATGLQAPARPLVRADEVLFKDVLPGGGVGPAFLQRALPSCPTAGAGPVGPAGAGPGDLVVDGDGVLFTSQESGDAGWVGRLR